MPEPALARLREAGRVELNPDAEHIMRAAELRDAVRRADVLVCLQHNDVDASVIDANPGLRLIASMAIEPASIDVAHATARGIPVTTIPPLVTEATADLHWGLLLATARRIPESEAALRRGVFPGAQSMRFVGGEVHGKTLGIVGIGRVGQGDRPARGGIRDAGPLRGSGPPAPGRGGRARCRASPARRPARRGGLRVGQRDADAGNGAPDRASRARADARIGLSGEHVARARRGREGAGGRARDAARSPGRRWTCTRRSPGWSPPSSG